MPKLTLDAWQELRASHEIGTSFTELSRRFGVSRQAIQKRAKTEGWQVDPEASKQIRERVAVKVASSPAKKDQAIEAAADQVAEVIKTHRSEWRGHRALYALRDVGRDFEGLKCAKIAAEMISLRQRAERQAWNLDTDNGDDAVEIVIQRSYAL